MKIRAADLIHSDLPLLPATMRDLIVLIGLEPTVGIINAFGGMQISIPKHANANRHGAAAFARLMAVIGEPHALALCREYGGERLSLPACHLWRTEVRARAIRQAFDDGATVDELVRRFGLTYRAIEQILKRAP